jgi:hypothetical protein
MYNRKRKKKEVERVTSTESGHFPDVLKEKKEPEIDMTPVTFTLNVDLDVFIYSLPRYLLDQCVREEEQRLGKGYKDWNKEENHEFLYNLRWKAKLTDIREMGLDKLQTIPVEAMTESERSRYFALKRRHQKISEMPDVESEEDFMLRFRSRKDVRRT